MMVAINNYYFPSFEYISDDYLALHIFFFSFFLLYKFAYIVLLCVFFGIDDEFIEKQQHRAGKKAHRKDFVQRMHARNGKAYFLEL
jgi:hypothetical protein